MSITNNPVGAITGYLGQQVGTDSGGASTLDEQAKRNQQIQQMQLQNSDQLFRQQQRTYGAQNQLAGSLQNTINNPYATSVANTQLASGLNQIAGQQRAAASGASGDNAFAARRAAMSGIAAAGAGANDTAALARAQEVANAQNSLAALYGTQLGAQNTGMGTAQGTAVGVGNTTEAGQSAIEQANAAAQQANAKANSNFLGSLGSGIASLAAFA